MRFFKPINALQMFRLRILYRKSFPKCERKPFAIIKAMSKKGRRVGLFIGGVLYGLIRGIFFKNKY